MPSPHSRGRSGLSSAAVLLVLVALTGKLAFVTLSKKQLQSTNGAVALLQAGGSTSLDRELSQLMKERTQLAHRYEVVSAAEHKREKAARHQKALLAHEHQELARLQHLKAEMGHKKLNGAKKTGVTHMDEAAVRKMVHKEFQLEKRAAQRRHAQAEEAAREEKRKQALARHQLQAQEMQAEVRTEAKRELVAEGLFSASAPHKTGKQAHAELIEHEKNLALATANSRLADEARHMAVALQWAPKYKAHAHVGVGGQTGIGDPLKRFGVVEDSWGPLTSNADTQSDPRDSFAQAPNRAKEYHYHGLPYTVTPSEKRVITKDALHILPNIEKREQAAEAKAKMSESKLEQVLGFDSSVLMSHSFDAALKHG